MQDQLTTKSSLSHSDIQNAKQESEFFQKGIEKNIDSSCKTKTCLLSIEEPLNINKNYAELPMIDSSESSDQETEVCDVLPNSDQENSHTSYFHDGFREKSGRFDHVQYLRIKNPTTTINSKSREVFL